MGRSQKRAAPLGISLVEVLVSITILALATSIAFVLYDGARRSFKIGDNLAEQQQVVRIGFDVLSRDLRMAGYNHNPDGSRTRPDEQIEAAYDRAIVIRADFDADDAARRETPETDLAGAGSLFPAVSVGNDEIVAYVLAKSDGSSNDTLSFDADVLGVPRDGVVDRVDIPDVALTHDDPPYTLYRVTVDDAASTTRRVPLIDHIRALEFTYYDGAARTLSAPGGADASQADVDARATIRRVGVRIEGLTRDPDPRWNDPSDTDPDTREYRKFELAGDVTPPNLGLFGVRDLGAGFTLQAKPLPPSLYPGHCLGLWAEWTGTYGQVAAYQVHYGTDPGNLLGPVDTIDPEVYLTGLLDDTEYYVTVTAIGVSGAATLPSDPASVTTENLNFPVPLTGLVASTDQSGSVALSWDPLLENISPSQPTNDPLSPQMRDFHHYSVYRGSNPGFADVEANEIIEVTLADHVDRTVVNCRPYYYKVQTSDWCGVHGESPPAALGKGFTIVKPAAPQNVQAYRNPGDIHVLWDPVTSDAVGDAIRIEDYKLWRTPEMTQGSLPSDSDFVVRALVPNATDYWDPVVPSSGMTHFYRVSAYDDCPNESAKSSIAEAICPFSGTVVIVQPAVGFPVSGVVPVEVDVDGGVATYDQLDLTITKSASGEPVLEQHITPPPFPGTPYVTIWDESISPPGQYYIDVTVTQSNGCIQSTRRLVTRI